MSQERWQVGVRRDDKPAGEVRHSQLLTTYGPGALVDLVDEAVIISGLQHWAKGRPIIEDRLLAMLRKEEGFKNVELFEPPPRPQNPDDLDRQWIKAFRFPEWFICQNDDCYEEALGRKRPDGAQPRRLIYARSASELDHRCSGKGKSSKLQPMRFVRACKNGHIDDIDWPAAVHRKNPDCTRKQLWFEESTSGDFADIRLSCTGCTSSIRMNTLKAVRDEDGLAPLGLCNGRRPWIGDEARQECSEPFRLLTRSASNAFFSVPASVIHIPDPDAAVREKVSSVFKLLKGVTKAAQIGLLRELQADELQKPLVGLSDEAVFAEVVRQKENKPVTRKKVKEAELEMFLSSPPERGADQPGARFYARSLPTPRRRPKLMSAIDKVVLVHRLTEVRAMVGFTRFEAQGSELDGELELNPNVAYLDDPITWLPAAESHGEGFFFSLKDSVLEAWGEKKAVQARERLIREGFDTWKLEREDRKKSKPDFATARFVMLHSLSHLLISAVSLECGYAASSIRERLYAGEGGTGLLLYTASTGAEGSLGGLIEVGRHLDRYLELALDLGHLCANDPVCAAHVPTSGNGAGARHLEGASCHGCLLISEPSCERMNTYLDRTLVVPTVEDGTAAFFGAR